MRSPSQANISIATLAHMPRARFTSNWMRGLLKLSLKLGLFSLFFLTNPNKRAGGGGRNRPDFPAVAPLICLISLGIQAKTVLSEPIVFNPFGVRFGVRLPISIL
jgi:hypothetical protein